MCPKPPQNQHNSPMPFSTCLHSICLLLIPTFVLVFLNHLYNCPSPSRRRPQKRTNSVRMINFRSRSFCRGGFKIGGGGNGSARVKKGGGDGLKGCGGGISSEIKWELRPGGMLVQKREYGDSSEGMISLRVSTVSQWHDISIEATSTFGELKMILALVTNLEPREQRLLFKGKEREDEEYLHMVGVKDKDKVLLLEDPAMKEMKKLHSLGGEQDIGTTNAYCTISV